MEYVGFDPHKVHANIHCTAYNHMKHNGKGSKIELTSPWTQFHDYAIEWHEDRIEFFCDDTRYFVYRKAGDDVASWPFAKPHFLILNLAIGGGWGGVQGRGACPRRRPLARRRQPPGERPPHRGGHAG